MKSTQIVCFVLFAGFMFFVAFVIHANNVGLKVKQMPMIAGRIVYRYLTRRSGGGRGGNPLVLAFKLDNLSLVLGVYRPSHDYSDLLASLNIGDSVTVYYRPLATNPIDIDVFQVEKDGKIIVDYSDYSRNHAIASNFLVAIGVVFLLIAVGGMVMKTQPRYLKAR